jgi:PAS domain S-box-containing protein
MESKDIRPKDAGSIEATISSAPTASAHILRRRAEKIVLERTAHSSEGQELQSLEDAGRTLFELQVHQIELEMQNDELSRTNVELDIIWERYFDLWDLAPAGYCTLSDKGIVLEANLTAAMMLGVPRGELVNKPISQFIRREDQDIFYLHRKMLFETSQPQMGELRMMKMDGTLVWTTLASTVAQDADGAPSYRIVISDISERKKAQEEKEKLEIQLKKAQRMQSIGRLAGGVAHGFNNMMGVILAYTEMALDKLNPDQPFYDDFQVIQNAALRSAELTRQLVAFAGNQIITPKILNLNQTVEGALQVLRSAIGENNELVWQPGAGLWPVKMDPAQFEQVMTNLCENAQDALAGQGMVTIATENITLAEADCRNHPWLIAGDYVQLTVKDNGRGIDKETIDSLFEPFFTSQEIFKGAGLGLAVVYGSIKQNQGFVDIVSQPGKGASVIIYLPRYKGTERKVHTREAGQPDRTKQKKILLVEDEPIVLELVAKLLEIKGYAVLATSDAHEAIRLAHEHAYTIDLLLTDVIMPEMNGDELAQKLLAEDPSLSCLFMSGYPADIITDRGLVHKGINFIQKPFGISDLMAKIQQVLKS